MQTQESMPFTKSDSSTGDWRVGLISMPFVSIDKPSIQLGLLKPLAESQGFHVENFHLCLDFARQIGPDSYSILSEHRGHLFGDWLFSPAAFGEASPDPDGRLLRDFTADLRNLSGAPTEQTAEWLYRLRAVEVPRFIELLMKTISWGSFNVIGFTSTFQQSVASFALASRIKRRYPNVCTLFGGANFDSEMGPELVRTIEAIDYAIVGEADEAFPEFLNALRDGRDPSEVSGVVCRRTGSVTALQDRKPFIRMDDLPIPNYDDFFDRSEALGLLDKSNRHKVGLPFESSRGCWWGQKHHCTFCGLNAGGMAFRAKSPERVVSELGKLCRRYRTFRFEAVDNILPANYLQGFLPCLVGKGYHYTLFYEIKANLKREQVRLLHDAGVHSIQPGIESLNSHVLDLMRKGVTAIQNVNLLRWAAYYGICVVWNIIWGFPGETERDYQIQSELIPHLIHLQPPLSTSRIWMERFSPIFFDRERFPARTVRAEASYSYVYPETVDLQRVAYFFDYEFDERLPDSSYEPVMNAARRWQEAWQRRVPPELRFRASDEFVQIEDRRKCEESLKYTLTGPVASLYASCSDAPQALSSLKRKLDLDWRDEKIEKTLDALCEQGLMMRDRDLFLSLALPVAPETDRQRSI
jgi:ribosomal peptide maturation radical SAM protein 1